MDPTREAQLRQLHAEICSGLADPRRILILYALASGPKPVGQVAAELQLDASSISRHLRILRQHGLVTAARVGAQIRYAVADERLIEALELLRGVLRDNLWRRAELAQALEAA